MATLTSRSNSPTYSSPIGTRSRSTSASQFSQKLKGLFKFSHSSVSSGKSSQPSSSTEYLPGLPTPPSDKNGTGTAMSGYFHHHGPPTHHHYHQHHHHRGNGSSTGRSSADGMDSLGGDSINMSESEETINTTFPAVTMEPKPTASTSLSSTSALKNQLRRVASAPNAHGLLSPLTKNGNNSANASTPNVESRKISPLAPQRPPTADGIPNSEMPSDARQIEYLLSVPQTKEIDRPETQKTGGFRRTYSSNSIKIRNVEVGPGSFEKIKLLGKGDVGKVYLVREKKSSRLYAMKGSIPTIGS